MESFSGFNKINVDDLKLPEVIDFDGIPKGDMPGDKIQISEQHIMKAQTIFHEIVKQLTPMLQANKRVVLSIYGGSGVGKSEIGALMAYFLNSNQLKTYIISGDNYPRRIPKTNDAERCRVFRENGIKGLVSSGEYKEERNQVILRLQEEGNDSDPAYVEQYPWLAVYQESGGNGLKDYLGTKAEIDFNEINNIILQFKQGKDSIFLKRMGRKEEELWYDEVDFSKTDILIIEWTHGNNGNLHGVDIPIYLHSTPQETLAHRKLRNRDGATDSPFTMMVLDIEQQLPL